MGARLARLVSLYGRASGNKASNRVPNPMMLKRQPGTIARRQSCNALRTWAIDSPAIDPDRSTRKMTSAGSPGTLHARVEPDGNGRAPVAVVLVAIVALDPGVRHVQTRRVEQQDEVAIERRLLLRQGHVAWRPLTVTPIGCDGDSRRVRASGSVTFTMRDNPYGTCQASGGFRVSASGRPTPPVIVGRRIARRYGRRHGKSQPLVGDAELGHVAIFSSTSLPGGRLPTLAKDIGRSSSSRNAPSPRASPRHTPRRLRRVS